MQMTQTQPLLSVKDVQTRLSISRTKAYELITSGAIKSVRIGDQYRIESADLEAYIAANSNQQADKAGA